MVPKCPKAILGDREFADRFDLESLLEDRVVLLNESRGIRWASMWDQANAAPLWNFNVHYCEFLVPLAVRWQETGERRFLDCAKQAIRGWIVAHPKGCGGAAWAPYVVSLRATAWLSFLAVVHEDIGASMYKMMEDSLYEHLVFLERNLELDILGNHLFENLKALILLGIAFGDDAVRDHALEMLVRELDKQVLSDGMHAELSPMYHGIVLEGLVRVLAAIGANHRMSGELEGTVQRMLDAAATLLSGSNRVPHFNDSATGISRSFRILAEACREQFGMSADGGMELPSAGYRVLESGDWHVIVDTGAVGYMVQPGHAHCDMLSFELYWRGEPVLVNCGTYAYQSDLRSWFRSTSSHNTLQVVGVEQSECWAVFRVGRMARIRSAGASGNWVEAVMEDCEGNVLSRRLTLGEGFFSLEDRCAKKAASRIHVAPCAVRAGIADCVSAVTGGASATEHNVSRVPYSERFGVLEEAVQLEYLFDCGRLSLIVNLERAESLLLRFRDEVEGGQWP